MMRKIGFISAILFFVFLLSPIIWAQSKDIEIDGLIMDQTKTKMGHDFANNFTLSWESAATGYNIVIEEQADFQTGSWISIEVNGNLVFKAALRPNPDAIEDLVKEAVESLNDYLFNLSKVSKALEEEKDMKGSGI